MTRPPWRIRARDAGFVPSAIDDHCPACGQRVGAFALQAPNPRGQARAACGHCADVPVPWQRLVRLGNYEAPLRDALLELKNTAFRGLAHDLGRAMGEVVLSHLRDAGLSPAQCVLVPVPTSLPRRLLRGIDHPLALARGVRSATDIAIAPALRRSHRPRQAGSSRRARRENVARTMSVRLSWSGDARWAQGRTLLLVDDILTTGATMQEASRALLGWWSQVHRGQDVAPPLSLWACPLSVVPSQPSRTTGKADGKA